MAQSAVPCRHYSITGSFIGLNQHELIPMEPNFDPMMKMCSRGHSPNCGDGPWFCAKKRVSRWSTGSSTIITGQDKYGWDNTVGLYYISRGNGYTKVQANSYQGFCRVTDERWSYRFADGEIVEIHESREFKGNHLGWPSMGIDKAKALSDNSSAPYSISERTVYSNGKWLISFGASYIWAIPEPEEFLFKNHELTAFSTIENIDIIPAPYAGYWSAAYVKASQEIPEANINSIANVIELAGSLKSIAESIRNPLKALKKSLKEAEDPRNWWLSYRYQYMTTMLDIKEVQEFQRRLDGLIRSTNDSICCSGEVTDGLATYRVVLRFSITGLPSGIADLQSALGFDLTLVNAWDMVPYSFVVDWFLGIGSMLEWLENWSGAITLQPDEAWFTYYAAYSNQSIYFRVPGRTLNVPPVYEDRQTSEKTLRMRIADAISLFTK